MKNIRKYLVLALLAISLFAVAMPAMASTYPPGGYRTPPGTENITISSAYYAQKNLTFILTSDGSGTTGARVTFSVEAWDSVRNTYVATGVSGSCPIGKGNTTTVYYTLKTNETCARIKISNGNGSTWNMYVY